MRRAVALVAAVSLAAAGTFATAGPSRAADVGPWHFNQVTGHLYQLVYDVTWEEGEAYAESIGGHLVTINDADEDAWIEGTFTDPFLWIGFTDRAVEGTWVWASGEPVTYENWCDDQPDDWQAVGGEDYGFINGTYCTGWDDAGDGPFPAGIVELAGPTLTTPAFTVEWSPFDPEEILSISWQGSPNLTNSSPNLEYPCGGDSEFFGNSWGGDSDAGFVSPVGSGTTGTWATAGPTRAMIRSAASGCYGTSGIPVATSYQFFASGATANQFLVQRRFSFGTTPFDRTFRPYIPRLYPVETFTTVLHPNAAGTELLSEDQTLCWFGCTVTDWNQSWFAEYDPSSGLGMIVRHVRSGTEAVLWIDNDSYSNTSATAVALVPPAGGFTGTLVENESLCFFDASSWTPSLTLPRGCR